MKKKVVEQSTTRSTAGSGFDFEDRVAAWLLLKVLTGQPLPGIEGIGSRLQAQVEALGWAIDDILLTATTPLGDQRHLAISCKSNVQVTASGLPADFVVRCWRQWAQADPNPMRRGKDRLMLATRGRHNEFMATWTDLKNAAGGADVALALNRMTGTAKHRKIFESVKTPAGDAGLMPSDEDVVAMVNGIEVTPLDFQNVNSESEAQEIAKSRMLLVDCSCKEGKRLWEELITQAKNVRLGSGTLEIADLWKLLRSNFELKDYPDYESSWHKLRAFTEDYKRTIETALPSGRTLDQEVKADQLLAEIATNAVCVVFGESGTGKSALVKAILNKRFPNATQVWFGPDNFDLALNEATRARLGIDQPLTDVLNVSASTENFLVIDAAERLSHDCLLKGKALIEKLKNGNTSLATAPWRVLIIGQTGAWVGGSLRELAGVVPPRSVEVENLPIATVEDVLCSVPSLEWLATHSDAVSALTNLRTLAWVIQAAAQFRARDGNVTLSLTTIADRLWTHWTDGKPSVQRFLMRLAEREADFKHSFAISELEAGDATILDSCPVACPLRRDKVSGRIRFEHDLAADWARYQRLREIVDDTSQWAQFAANPSWHGALRMLGQLLLRQQVETRSAWDVAFEEAEQNRETAPLADDILLEVLFLDPNAEAFLDQRADMLLENSGARLSRLVNRFEYVASVSGLSPDMQGRFGDLSLYIEAHFRTPIFARWPALARFLVKYRDIVAKMTSPAIARLCYRWLTSTPTVLPDGAATPFRREFAELAMASAREMQLRHAKGSLFIDESEALIYQAALAGAPDLPSDVSEWALEMAQRRAYRTDIVEQVQAHRAEQALKHRRRAESDPTYRERHVSMSIFAPRRLPPWPLGPNRRLEGQFREAVLRSASFQALIRTNPSVAGEVLLACVIEDEPEEQYSSARDVEGELGIEPDAEAYPTAPWKSPFYAFLQINSDTALDYLHQLVNFATDRWVHAVRKNDGSDPTTISLRLADGAVREYEGNSWIFTWSHKDSPFIGQLYSAIAALERWLCDLIDTGTDVAPQLDALLQATNSVAVLGVLVNVGKYCDELFKGPLRPLLGVQDLYGWDFQRVTDSAYAFDAITWARSDEIAFEMAKKWVFAPYRKRKLREIVPEMVVADKEVGDFVVAASSHWVSPKTEKEILEFRILVAELDHRNYSLAADPETEKQTWAFAYPPDVAAAISEFQQNSSRTTQALTFPQTCRDVFTQARMLNAEEAEWVASLMTALDGEGEIDIDEEMRLAPRVAAATVLLLRAPDWLAQNATIEQRAQSIIDAAITDIADESGARGPRILMAASHLEFVAHFVIERWLTESANENDERVLRLLTSGDEVAVQVLVWSAYQNREALGQRWRRLLYLALLWSGLSMLTPRYDDEEGVELRWRRWCRWLRTRSLSAGNMSSSSINPLAVAERVERLESKRWRRRCARDGYVFRKEPTRRLSGSLDTRFLKGAFAWLFHNGDGRVISNQEQEAHRQLVSAFWAHQAWWLSGSGENDNDDYQPMGELGYAILNELARLIGESPITAAPALWCPVFALGPKGHYAIGHFLTCWFSQITEATVVAEFAQRWRPMIEYMVLNDKWAKDGPWYYSQQLERQVLGFGASDSLKRVSDHTMLVGMMRDLFNIWAKKRLAHDEDNLAGFCGFLGNEAGKSLRLDGLQWIADAMNENPDLGKWFRDRTSSAFMEFLNVLVSEHATELGQDEEARQALLVLSAHAASLQLPAALVLHDRIRRLP